MQGIGFVRKQGPEFYPEFLIFYNLLTLLQSNIICSIFFKRDSYNLHTYKITQDFTQTYFCQKSHKLNLCIESK